VDIFFRAVGGAVQPNITSLPEPFFFTGRIFPGGNTGFRARNGENEQGLGENIFMAEFGSKQDWEKVLDGSPWSVGNKAVVVQRFSPNLRPSEVTFDKMAVWIIIYDLPFGLMNNKWV
jgi:hypothetical protein